MRLLLFVVGYMLGLKWNDSGETYEITPCTMGVRKMEARIPWKEGRLAIHVKDGKVISRWEKRYDYQ